MIKFISIILISLLACLGGSAQTDSISMRKASLGGWNFYQDHQRLKLSQVKKKMEVNPNAYKHINAAAAANTVSSCLSFAGGLCVGWSLGSLAIGKDPAWMVTGIGAALIGVSIPFASKASRESKKAVSLYNEGLGMVSGKDTRSMIRLNVLPGAIGLVWGW